MPSEEEAYRQCVYDLWIVRAFAKTFANDLMKVLFDNGFLIDNVTLSASDDEHITWSGRCYDVDLTDYKFKATWTFNLEKFTGPNSQVHYYELSDLDIEPL